MTRRSVLSAGSSGSGEHHWPWVDSSTCEQRSNPWPQTSCWALFSCRVSICPLLCLHSHLINNEMWLFSGVSVGLGCYCMNDFSFLIHLSTFFHTLFSVFALCLTHLSGFYSTQYNRFLNLKKFPHWLVCSDAFYRGDRDRVSHIGLSFWTKLLWGLPEGS